MTTPTVSLWYFVLWSIILQVRYSLLLLTQWPHCQIIKIIESIKWWKGSEFVLEQKIVISIFTTDSSLFHNRAEFLTQSQLKALAAFSIHFLTILFMLFYFFIHRFWANSSIYLISFNWLQWSSEVRFNLKNFFSTKHNYQSYIRIKNTAFLDLHRDKLKKIQTNWSNSVVKRGQACTCSTNFIWNWRKRKWITVKKEFWFDYFDNDPMKLKPKTKCCSS